MAQPRTATWNSRSDYRCSIIEQERIPSLGEKDERLMVTQQNHDIHYMNLGANQYRKVEKGTLIRRTSLFDHSDIAEAYAHSCDIFNEPCCL